MKWCKQFHGVKVLSKCDVALKTEDSFRWEVVFCAY